MNVSSGTSVVPQNPPTFRIAPVSSQLINAAAARRVRDPRLRKIEQQDSKPRNSSTIVNKTKSSPSAQVEANKDKRNGLYIILLRVKLIANVICVRNLLCFLNTEFRVQWS